jgi:hypothetical protein
MCTSKLYTIQANFTRLRYLDVCIRSRQHETDTCNCLANCTRNKWRNSHLHFTESSASNRNSLLDTIYKKSDWPALPRSPQIVSAELTCKPANRKTDRLLNFSWPSPAQRFLLPSPTEPMTIFYSLTALGIFRLNLFWRGRRTHTPSFGLCLRSSTARSSGTVVVSALQEGRSVTHCF